MKSDNIDHQVHDRMEPYRIKPKSEMAKKLHADSIAQAKQRRLDDEHHEKVRESAKQGDPKAMAEYKNIRAVMKAHEEYENMTRKK